MPGERKDMSRSSKRGLAIACLAVACVALNGVGATAANDLPDDRAYELVSPGQKGVADVMAENARVRLAADGSAASFASLGAFGDVVGTGVGADYVSVRDAAPGTQGWETHSVTPPQSAMSFTAVVFGQDPLYDGAFSDDLSKGIFRAWTPLTDAPNVSRVENLYLRDDLRTAGPGSYTLLTDAPAPVGSEDNAFINVFSGALFAGASHDFKHLLFESFVPRAPGVPDDFSPRLYEWNEGMVRVAGILPDDSIAPTSEAGQGAINQRELPHVISSDGSRIVFTVASGFCGSSSCGDLYERIDHTTTIKLNASERTDCAGDPTCGGDGIGDPAPDPTGPAPAIVWDASADGTRIFFTTSEALTDDAPVDGNRKLYMYDASKQANDPHNLIFIASNDVQGVIGVGDDGRNAYFITPGQLVPGGPSPINHGIFAWHDDGTAHGSLAYVGAFAQNADTGENLLGDYVLNPLRSRVTPDGRHLLFSAQDGAELTGYDHGSCSANGTVHGTCRELYLYNADSASLVCVSCDPTGAPGSGDAFIRIRDGNGASSAGQYLPRAMSDDGSRVFFSTTAALVPQDVNGKSDAYEYDVRAGRAQLISTGTSTSPSYFMNASPSGDDVLFTTRQALVGWDTDGNVDLYDARVHGGFPDPQPAPPACSGDACRGPASTPPQQRSAGSAEATGNGNVRRAKHRCKRGHVRKHVHRKVRCVRRRHHHASRPGHAGPRRSK
jgi:hypothetical protein